ncbi:2Fe-2S iron-sulfur cluster-binding protein (plasmid) [Mycolicibacterium sp. ELW1]|uniref:2Fe-2S iron-sulfur cluster-binding protein n=1 Tax=Mycobacteriaceae TaxID=1762 RepID=UPI0011EE107C|nr:2Fe-2S iron-sulfur cluster binding domain-containing protein [Mycobacterium sp. ELW1]QEN17566.1 2Fe-2S iron-sulfur cluster binding domain-containing protein [Mycobacterium sp. ELW1]
MSAKVTFEGHDAVVDCEPNATMLQAGLRAGLQLPYECASGGCGSCRAQLLEGDTETLWSDANGLTERDRRRGNRLLMCQTIPNGNCKIKVPALSSPPAVAEPRPEHFGGELVGRVLLTSDTALFTVGLDRPMTFLPGQFVLFQSWAGVRRAYSMAHPQRADATMVEFVIKAKPGGSGSIWLFDEISLGDSLMVEGPYGRAYARPNSEQPVLCVAGGTGLAPILAITEQVLTTGQAPSLHLYVGARSDGDLVLLDRLVRLRDMGASITLAAEQIGDEPIGNPLLPAVKLGSVVDQVLADWNHFAGYDIYLGGPAGMVDAALRALVRHGDAAADRVFFDRFL